MRNHKRRATPRDFRRTNGVLKHAITRLDAPGPVSGPETSNLKISESLKTGAEPTGEALNTGRDFLSDHQNGTEINHFRDYVVKPTGPKSPQTEMVDDSHQSDQAAISSETANGSPIDPSETGKFPPSIFSEVLRSSPSILSKIVSGEPLEPSEMARFPPSIRSETGTNSPSICSEMGERSASISDKVGERPGNAAIPAEDVTSLMEDESTLASSDVGESSALSLEDVGAPLSYLEDGCSLTSSSSQSIGDANLELKRKLEAGLMNSFEFEVFKRMMLKLNMAVLKKAKDEDEAQDIMDSPATMRRISYLQRRAFKRLTGKTLRKIDRVFQAMEEPGEGSLAVWDTESNLRNVVKLVRCEFDRLSRVLATVEFSERTRPEYSERISRFLIALVESKLALMEMAENVRTFKDRLQESVDNELSKRKSSRDLADVEIPKDGLGTAERRKKALEQQTQEEQGQQGQQEPKEEKKRLSWFKRKAKSTDETGAQVTKRVSWFKRKALEQQTQEEQGQQDPKEKGKKVNKRWSWLTRKSKERQEMDRRVLARPDLVGSGMLPAGAGKVSLAKCFSWRRKEPFLSPIDLRLVRYEPGNFLTLPESATNLSAKPKKRLSWFKRKGSKDAQENGQQDHPEKEKKRISWFKRKGSKGQPQSEAKPQGQSADLAPLSLEEKNALDLEFIGVIDPLPEPNLDDQMKNAFSWFMNAGLEDEGSRLESISNPLKATVPPEDVTFAPEGKTRDPEGQTNESEDVKVDPEGVTKHPQGVTVTVLDGTVDPRTEKKADQEPCGLTLEMKRILIARSQRTLESLILSTEYTDRVIGASLEMTTHFDLKIKLDFRDSDGRHVDRLRAASKHNHLRDYEEQVGTKNQPVSTRDLTSTRDVTSTGEPVTTGQLVITGHLIGGLDGEGDLPCDSGRVTFRGESDPVVPEGATGPMVARATKPKAFDFAIEYRLKDTKDFLEHLERRFGEAWGEHSLAHVVEGKRSRKRKGSAGGPSGSSPATKGLIGCIPRMRTTSRGTKGSTKRSPKGPQTESSQGHSKALQKGSSNRWIKGFSKGSSKALTNGDGPSKALPVGDVVSEEANKISYAISTESGISNASSGSKAGSAPDEEGLNAVFIQMIESLEDNANVLIEGIYHAEALNPRNLESVVNAVTSELVSLQLYFSYDDAKADPLFRPLLEMEEARKASRDKPLWKRPMPEKYSRREVWADRTSSLLWPSMMILSNLQRPVEAH